MTPRAAAELVRLDYRKPSELHVLSRLDIAGVQARKEEKKRKARERSKAYYRQHREKILAKRRHPHPCAIARQAGETHYRSTCPAHGIVLRSVKSRWCPDCLKEYRVRRYHERLQRSREVSRNNYHKHKERILARLKAIREADPEAHRRAHRAYRSANREKERAANRRRYAKDPASSRAVARDYAKRNLAKVRAYKAALQSVRSRRCREQQPAWLTREQIRSMHAFYRAAKAEGLAVDHRVPLTPCRVCGAYGLHVPWNLQAIPHIENARKQNRCDTCWDAAA